MAWPFDRWFRALVWFAAIAVALTLVRLFCLAGIEISHNYNEGWNAYNTLAAMTGGSPYPAPSSLIFNNYPPLSFYIVGAAGKLFGDIITAGRLVSLASTIFMTWAVFAIARAMGCAKIEASFAASLVLAKILAASDYVGINDPQMLGQALGCAGFLAVVREPRTARNVALGAFLLTAALFVKHMLLVQPLVLAAWLAMYDRRNAIRFVAFGVFFALGGYALCRIALGADLFDVMFTDRLYQLHWLAQSLADFLLVSFAPLGAALFLLASKDRYAKLCALYGVTAFAIGLYFDGGAGVGRNALFDAAIGCALAAALLLRTSRQSAPGLALLFALACFVPLGVATLQKAEPSWATEDFWLNPLGPEQTETKSLVAFIRDRPGPALCERLVLCYWAGKPAQVDAFNYIQAVATGHRSEDELVRLITARAFSTVIISKERTRFRSLPGVLAALRQNYKAVRSGERDQIFIAR